MINHISLPLLVGLNACHNARTAFEKALRKCGFAQDDTIYLDNKANLIALLQASPYLNEIGLWWVSHKLFPSKIYEKMAAFDRRLPDAADRKNIPARVDYFIKLYNSLPSVDTPAGCRQAFRARQAKAAKKAKAVASLKARSKKGKKSHHTKA